MATVEELNATPLPLSRLLGITFLDIDPAHVVAEMLVRPELCTAGERAHGGTLMALADTVAATGTASNLPKGASGTTTIESKTNFVSGAPTGSRLLATAIPIHRGRQTQVWQTRVENEEGKLVAIVMQTQMVLYPNR